MTEALGIAVAVLAAVFVAGSMSIQRYALRAQGGERVRFLKRDAKSGHVWLIGLVGYTIGNLLQAFSLTLGPLFLIGSMFTSMLLFNVFFGWQLLGERPGFKRSIGTVCVLIGVVAIATAPRNADQSDAVDVSGTLNGTLNATLNATSPYTQSIREGDNLEALVRRPQSIAFMSVIASLVFLAMLSICRHESRVPTNVNSPRCLAQLTRVAMYPMAMGIEEGICQLCARATFLLLPECTTFYSCGRPMLWLSLASWLAFAAVSVWFMRKVYRNFEVTVALPIEYGCVNTIVVASGLIVFDEAQTLTKWAYRLSSRPSHSFSRAAPSACATAVAASRKPRGRLSPTISARPPRPSGPGRWTRAAKRTRLSNSKARRKSEERRGSVGKRTRLSNARRKSEERSGSVGKRTRAGKRTRLSNSKARRNSEEQRGSVGKRTRLSNARRNSEERRGSVEKRIRLSKRTCNSS